MSQTSKFDSTTSSSSSISTTSPDPTLKSDATPHLTHRRTTSSISLNSAELRALDLGETGGPNTDESRRWKAEVRKLQRALRQREEQLLDQENSAVAGEEKVRRLMHEISHQTLQNESLVKELDILKKEVKYKSSIIGDLETEVEDQAAEIEDLGAELTETKTINEHLREHIKTMQEEHEHHIKDLTEKSSFLSTKRNSIGTVDEEDDDQDESSQSLARQLKKMSEKQSKQMLKKVMKQLETEKKTSERLQNEVERLKYENETLRSEAFIQEDERASTILRLESDLMVQNQVFQKSLAELQQGRDKISSLSGELSRLKATHKELTERSQQLEAEVAAKEKALKGRVKQVSFLEDQLKKSQSASGTARQQLEEVTAKYHALKSGSEQRDRELTAVSEKLSAVTMQNDVLSSQVESLTSQEQKFRREATLAQQQVDYFSRRVQSLDEALDGKEQQVGMLKLEAQQARQDLKLSLQKDRYTKVVTSLEEERDRLSQEVSAHIEQNVVLQNEMERLTQVNQNIVNSKQQTIDRLEMDLQNIFKHHQASIEENDRLNRQVKSLKEQQSYWNQTGDSSMGARDRDDLLTLKRTFAFYVADRHSLNATSAIIDRVVDALSARQLPYPQWEHNVIAEVVKLTKR